MNEANSTLGTQSMESVSNESGSRKRKQTGELRRSGRVSRRQKQTEETISDAPPQQTVVEVGVSQKELNVRSTRQEQTLQNALGLSSTPATNVLSSFSLPAPSPFPFLSSLPSAPLPPTISSPFSATSFAPFN